MPRPRLALFDVNETLSDLEPLRTRFEGVGAPGELLEVWFASTPRDGFALTAAGAYADFPHDRSRCPPRPPRPSREIDA
jgi:2-haloacid dehalogenase